MRSLALLILVAAPFAGHAQPSPAQAVRGYFDALGRQDFRSALAFTVAEAQKTTSHMVSTLQREAAEHGARVEVQVKEVDVAAPGSPEPGRGVPVPVQFHIDVVGHKWMFHKVARRLEGQARFWVDPDRADRIVAIEGDLE
jgi:hypothetical protein